MEFQNLFVVLLVIGSRLLVPLLIPRFPLPAIIACLIIDGIDQTVFQKYTTVNLDGYQGYDKALDIYYLAIAYLSTLRNWTNPIAFHISQFLFYYRIFGLTLFELTHVRALLFIFPNTFEYFFIFVSAIVLLWDMKRLKTKFLLLSAAFIWIFIKLPQEYWLHIAQLDMTDFLKENIFHVSTDASIEEIFAANSWIVPAVVIFAALGGVLVWYASKKLPKPDHGWQIKPDEFKVNFSKYMEVPSSFKLMMTKFRFEFAEKIILVGLITLIFAQIFPSFNGTNIQILLGVTFVILSNAVFSYMIMQSSKLNNSMLNKFFPMFVLNSFAAIIFANIASRGSSSISYLTILFFAYIITLLTILYDRFRPFYLSRFAK